MSGAGIQAAQEMAGRGVGAVITGNVGPNAYQVLSSAGIRILIGASGTVREAVEMFKRGQLQDATIPGSGQAQAGVEDLEPGWVGAWGASSLSLINKRP